MDYPHVCREALQRIEQLLLANKKHDFCLDIIADIIFQEPKIHRNASKQHAAAVAATAPSTLTLTEEFQLVIELADFFADRSARGPQTASTSNALFLSLFGFSQPANLPTAARPRVLAKLISTAISGAMPAVLNAAGTWMQQMGPTSACSADLARRLVDDFINYSRRGREQLHGLPQLAPRFAVNLITAVTELYLVDQANRVAPPAILLEVFTAWIIDAPMLCLGVQPPSALPAGAIAMPVMTPLAGLIRWCVLAPMYGAGAEEATTGGGGSGAYSRLHLAVLQSLAHSAQATTPVGAVAPLPGINALHLCAIVAAIRQMPAQSEGGEERVQASLERFAQSVQLALAARTITGNVTQLMCRLEKLPRNPLLQIVIRANKAVM